MFHFKIRFNMKNFIKRAFAEGATVADVSDFACSIIPPTPRRFWEPGCRIGIPEDFVLMVQSTYGKGRLPFLVVHVTFPDGHVQMDKLFLGTLTRYLRLPDGKVIAAHGTAVDYIRSFVNWADALNALRGTTIKVVDDVEYEIPTPCGDCLRKTHIYGFNICGGKDDLDA